MVTAAGIDADRLTPGETQLLAEWLALNKRTLIPPGVANG